jgi:hypothetical protein
MPQTLTDKYRTFQAQTILNGMSAQTVFMYMFVGRPTAWSDPDNLAINDGNPPAPETTTQAVDFDYWRDMLGAKIVGAANAQFVCTRRDWTVDVIYDQYDDQNTDLQSSDFYVLDTQETPFKVYKCLWNNHDARSTVAPSTLGTNVNPGTTADGYVWQYMYVVGSENARFLTTHWMPVLRDDGVVNNAVTFVGRLPTAVPLIITSGGSGYNAAVASTSTIQGDGAGAELTSNGISIVAGVVTSAILASGGANYTTVNAIGVTQAGVANSAVLRAIIPPYPNHGADAVKELGARALMLTVTFEGSEGTELSTDNDFRRVGLVANPLDASGNTANATFYRQTYNVTFSANTGVLHPDDSVTNITKGSNPTAVVVDVVPGGNSNYIVRLTDVNPVGEDTPFEAGEIIKNQSSGVEVTIESVEVPELKAYSGHVLYVNQRTPVTRANNQAEEIKLVLPFA